MMTEVEAKKIGSRQGLKSVGVGLLIAQLIMTWFSSDAGLLKGFLWFVTFSYNINLIIGVIIMLLSGQLFGQLAGKEILIKKRNYKWVGFKYGMATLLTTAFLASWTGFFQEGIHDIGTTDEPFADYIIKPLFAVFFFGLIPVLLVGFWFGRQIKKQENV
jgi:hypothetical protein